MPARSEDGSARIHGDQPLSTPSNLTDPGDAEIERIRQEYAARARELPPGYYDTTRPENQFLHASAARACARLLRRVGAFPIDRAQILDVGCGQGQWMLELLHWGATVSRLHAIDLLPERIAQARERLAGAELRTGDARRLPWPNGIFDLITQFTVFSSILNPGVKQQIASEMLRVLRPGGRILWYDMRRSNPVRPVRGIGRKEIGALFPDCTYTFLNSTLAPPVARTVAERSWATAFALESLPFMKTHLGAVITKK